MAATAELKKVKLNVTNIKSVLLDGKKAVDEQRKNREDFLQKLEEEKKKKQEEKGLEKPLKPISDKPDLKSPVKSSMGLMDRIFNFVGAIVGGIVVKALPGIIESIKKVIEYVKPIFAQIQEGLEPVFNFIGGFFKDTESYESEKEKVTGEIDEANLLGKDIDGKQGELDKAGKEIVNENKGLAENNKALGGEEIELQKDREKKEDDDKDDVEVKNNDNKVESNENVTVENLGPTSASVVTKMVDGKEVVVTDLDENLKIQNDARNMLKNATGDGEVVTSTTEISNVNVIVPPVMPVKENFPRTRQGRRNFRNAYKQYVIEMKQYNQTQKNLVKPSDSNKNGLTALNTTGGLTSINGSGSTTVVYQRQIVEKVIPVSV